MKKIFAILFVVVLVSTLVVVWPAIAAKPEKVSAPGQYSGYAAQLYKEVVVQAVYVEVRDGTKLAVDIYRPATPSGQVIQKPMPVVWTYTPYFRQLNESYKE